MTHSGFARLVYTALFGFYSFTGISQIHPQSEWELVTKEEDIEVFSRTRENATIKEIRITCEVKSSMDHMIDFLSNVPLYVDWVYKCDKSFLIKEESSNEFSYYISLDFPFPFDDRDLVINSKHWVDPTSGIYYSHSVTGDYASYTDEVYVHIYDFESQWNITPNPNGMLSIDYTAYSNPGGDIPIWLVNLAIAKGPLQTMKRFIQLVESE